MNNIAERFGYGMGIAATVFLILALAGTAWGHYPPLGPTQGQEYESEEEARELETFAGTLLEVDTEKQTLRVQSDEGKEKTFAYDENTVVEGALDTTEGLAGEAGTRVTVEYESGWFTDTAKRIQVMGVELEDEPAPDEWAPEPEPEPEPFPPPATN